MKYSKYDIFPPKHRKKAPKFLAVLCTVLILTVSVGGTLAYVWDHSDSLRNLFSPAQVDCQVQDVGNAICVKNTGDVDAYLRATLVVNWMDSAGNVSGEKEVPTVTPNANWKPVGNAYYYNAPVASGDMVEFVKDISGETSDEYTLTVEVVAEAIQADGMGAESAEDAWDIAIPDQN